MATTAKALGAVGCVSDGGLRDVVEVRALGGFQYFCPGFVVSHGKPFICEISVPVTLEGMTVHPGDLLHGDVNGVLVIPAADRGSRRRGGAARPRRRAGGARLRAGRGADGGEAPRVSAAVQALTRPRCVCVRAVVLHDAGPQRRIRGASARDTPSAARRSAATTRFWSCSSRMRIFGDERLIAARASPWRRQDGHAEAHALEDALVCVGAVARAARTARTPA